LINILQSNASAVYARKCHVEGISAADVGTFMNSNHIQGYAASSVNFALVHDGCVVAVMTFGKSRFNKQYQYELIRYAIKRNYNVVGGASKLFKHFIKQYKPTSIISYSDKRWNTGNVYSTIGFEFSHDTKPNYFYFKNNEIQLYSRQHFQKHKLVNKLEIFNPLVSEWDNMKLNKYNRIWDCGNSVWLWTSNN
jgi:hypothetical protein